MAEAKLKQTELEFKNSNSNTGSISFTTSNEFETDRAFKFSSGLVTSSLSVGSGAGFQISTDFDEIKVNDLKFKDDSGDVITVAAPSTVTAHTLTLPSAQGTANYVLTNDGSGTLSWSNPKGTWSQFGSTISSGFTNANNISTYDVDITSFKNGTDTEMLVEVRTSVHATTFILYKDLLSDQDYANNGNWRYSDATYDTRYVMYKIHDSQTNLEIEAGGGITLSHIRLYTR